jgi:hypothetical protein
MKRMLLSFLSLLLAVVPAHGSPDTAALGTSGETYLLRTGLYRNLFPNGTATDRSSSVLALEIMRHDQSPERLLVPETDGPDVESAGHVFFEEASGTVYVFWQTQDGGQPRLSLASWSDNDWSEVVTISEDSAELVGAPQITLTRDRFAVRLDGEDVEIPRTLLHVLWQERSGGGWKTLYRPLVLLGGEYKTAGPVLSLDDIVRSEDPALLSGPLTLLYPSSLLRHHDGALLSLVLADPVADRLVTVELQVHPSVLGVLAEELRRKMVEAAGAFEPADPQAYADIVRGHLIETGQRMNPRDLGFLAEVVRGHLIETGARFRGNLSELIEIVRGHLIETGVVLNQERVLGTPGPAPVQILELPSDAAGRLPIDLVSILGFSVVAALPLPDLPEAETWALPSPDGTRVIVAWKHGQVLRYLEGRAGDGWSSEHAVELSDSLTLELALELLRSRLSS